jgi:hypothetical protein
VDGRGRLAGQLLIHDRANDMIEVRALGAYGEPAWADLLDDARHGGVDPFQMTDGRAVHAAN